ncbi:MAG: TorF family putative porin [Gammaproteobacteria bacterium]
MKIDSRLVSAFVAAGWLSAASAQEASLTANAAVTNNYVWRGLTQTMNEPAVSGGLDYVTDSGFYIGTWVSNVSFAPSDVFSYEHDIYFGFSGGDNVTWDIGYLYYNYDDIADTDFGEIYATLGFGDFSISAYVLANTQLEEPPGLSFDFGDSYYLALDYAIPLKNDFALGLHLGRHKGDFMEVFNGVPGDYIDYGLSLSKGGFTFTISDADLDDEQDDGLDNGSVKFVIGYTFDFNL